MKIVKFAGKFTRKGVQFKDVQKTKKKIEVFASLALMNITKQLKNFYIIYKVFPNKVYFVYFICFFVLS